MWSGVSPGRHERSRVECACVRAGLLGHAGARRGERGTTCPRAAPIALALLARRRLALALVEEDPRTLPARRDRDGLRRGIRLVRDVQHLARRRRAGRAGQDHSANVPPSPGSPARSRYPPRPSSTRSRRPCLPSDSRIGATKAGAARVSSTAAAFFSAQHHRGVAGTERTAQTDEQLARRRAGAQRLDAQAAELRAERCLSRTNDLSGSGCVPKNAWASRTSFV